MDIDLNAGATDSGLQQLARQAMAGDKHAQLKLGTYYQYAADGLETVSRDLSSGRAQAADADAVRAIFETGLTSSELKKYGSWRRLAMLRARDLYESASIDSGGERLQVTPVSSPGGAVTTSRATTGPLKKGLPEAGRLLALIEEGIFREQFVTSFNDPYDEVCQNEYTYADWEREAVFIVEGRLSYRFVIRPSELPNRRGGPYFEAEIEIVRHNKWPENFPKPQSLTVRDNVRYGGLLDEQTGDYRGCETWGPKRDSYPSISRVVLQYHNTPIGVGKFEIINVF